MKLTKLTLHDAVKQRSGMYFGNPDKAIYSLLTCLIENSLKSEATKVSLIQNLNTYIITDNTMPLDQQVAINKLVFEANPSTNPQLHNDLDYMMFCIMAACEHFIIKTIQGVLYFKQGEITPYEQSPFIEMNLPDDWKMVFTTNTTIICNQYPAHLHQLAAYCKAMTLNYPHARITLENTLQTINLYYPNGATDHLEEISAFRITATPIIHKQLITEKGSCELALRFAYDGKHHILLYVNGILAYSGGSATKSLLKQLNIMLDSTLPTTLAIINLQIAEPRWHGNTKERLHDKRAYELVKALMIELAHTIKHSYKEAFKNYLE